MIKSFALSLLCALVLMALTQTGYLTAQSVVALVPGVINAQSVGMAPGGQDNSPFVQALMNAVGPAGVNSPGGVIELPPTNGQTYTYWYFSQPLTDSRGGTIDCKGYAAGVRGSSVLVFAPGVDGIRQESGYLSPDQGWGLSDITRCTLISLGGGTAENVGAVGSSTITGVYIDEWLPASFPRPQSCNPVAGECSIGVGDGVILINNWAPTNGQLIVAPGAYVATSTPTVRTITLAPPYTILGPLTMPDAAIFDLPASQVYTIQATAGSNTATVTAGPRPLVVGDKLWTSAFLFGSSVLSVSGNTFPQIIAVNNITLTSPAPAVATLPSATDPGRAWVIPDMIARRTQASTHQVTGISFPFGLDMTCSAGTVPLTGCNNSFDQQLQVTGSLIGWMMRGDNTAGSKIDSFVGASNYIADEGNFGTLGVTIVSDEDNSAEAGTSIYDYLTLCGTENYSVAIGSYLSGQGADECLGKDAQGNPNIGVAASGAGTTLFLNPVAGSPTPSISSGSFTGAWEFSSGSNCIVMQNDWYAWGISNNGCSTPSTWGFHWNSLTNSWDFNLWATETVMRFVGVDVGFTGNAGAGTGYAYQEFPGGLLLYNSEDLGDAPANSRMLCMSATMPTGAWHKQGDVCFNTNPTHGGPVGWTDMADGANFEAWGLTP